MHLPKKIGKREFIQHTSKYLQWVEIHGAPLMITHQNHPALVLTKIKSKTIKDLRGSVTVKVHGDLNEHVLPGFDKW